MGRDKHEEESGEMTMTWLAVIEERTTPGVPGQRTKY